MERTAGPGGRRRVGVGGGEGVVVDIVWMGMMDWREILGWWWVRASEEGGRRGEE